MPSEDLESDLELFHSFIDPLALLVLQLGRSDAMEAAVKEEFEANGEVRVDEGLEVVQKELEVAADEVEVAIVEDPGPEMEEVEAFSMEVETFCKQKNSEFRIPKFYGEDVDLLKLWTEVSKLGGYDTVCAKKLWRQVGRRFNPPKTCTSLSFTFRQIYEKALLLYERFRLGVPQTGDLVDILPSNPPQRNDPAAEAALRSRREDTKGRTEGQRIPSGLNRSPSSKRLKPSSGEASVSATSSDTRTDSDYEHAYPDSDAATELDAHNQKFELSRDGPLMGPDVQLSWRKMSRKWGEMRDESGPASRELALAKQNFARPDSDAALELHASNQEFEGSRDQSLRGKEVKLSWKKSRVRRKYDPARRESVRQNHHSGTGKRSSYRTGGKKWTVASIRENFKEESDVDVGPPPIEELKGVVADEDTPAEWVKISVYKTRDDFQIYALVPGLEPSELRVECEVSGRVVIIGSPKASQPRNLWGLARFRKVIQLPSEIETGEFRAIVSLYGQLLLRVPFLRDTHSAGMPHTVLIEKLSITRDFM